MCVTTMSRYISSIDTSGHVRNGPYLAEETIKVIEAAGPENITAVCTDNAAACKIMGELVTEKVGFYFDL